MSSTEKQERREVAAQLVADFSKLIVWAVVTVLSSGAGLIFRGAGTAGVIAGACALWGIVWFASNH